jgi:ABC-type branched-subunit amino acid transport system ATPase component/ABC-type branched-subunit amino acid transport system permease subunit
VCVLAVVSCVSGNNYYRYLVALVGLTTMVGVGLNILLGLSGQVSLGQVGFYAIGAYTAALLTTKGGVSFWLALVAAGSLAGLVGTLVAIPAMRVTGPYLAMVTIAFGFIVEHATVEWRALTGGANGLMAIPVPRAWGYLFTERDTTLVIVGLTAVVLVAFWQFRMSPWGAALQAVRDAEIAAQSLGLRPVVLRTTAFTLAAMLAGVAGALFAVLTGFISPGSFAFLQSILFLLGVILGGAGTVWGPLLGAVLVILLPESLAGLAEYRLVFFGGLLLVVLWLAPAGIAGTLAACLSRPSQRTAHGPGADVLPWLAQRGKGQALRVVDLHVAFGGVRAVAGMSCMAKPGQVTSLIGPNGAGKTTVLNVLNGLVAPTAGTVRLGASDVTDLPAYARARAGIARTYQTTQLFPTLSVLDNLLLALHCGKLGPPLALLHGARRAAARRQAAEQLLAFVGYSGPLEQPAAALAHGDRRLVDLARALALQPHVLLLDEPAAGLGPRDTERLGALVRQIAATGITVVLVEHDMRLVMAVSDHVVVLDAGRCIASGPPTHVRRDPAVRQAYLGARLPAGRTRPAAAHPEQEAVLTVQSFSAAYGAAPALEVIDLAVHTGELVAVLGANGAGKSTLLRALSGLHHPVRGTVRLRGHDVTQWAAHRRVRAGLVLVPEGRQVFPELTVLDNLWLGAYARPRGAIAQEIAHLLERFPALRARLHSRAGLLSGGEQQMLALARGLLARPRLLLLDEPSLGLAPALRRILFTMLAAIGDAGVPILLVEQMADLALTVADRGYVLHNGRVVHAGAAADLHKDAALEQAYLGTSQTSVPPASQQPSQRSSRYDITDGPGH